MGQAMGLYFLGIIDDWTSAMKLNTALVVISQNCTMSRPELGMNWNTVDVIIGKNN